MLRLTLTICFAVVAVAIAFNSNLHRSTFRSKLVPLRTLPEHLIDCANNPILADLYGGAGSAYCLQKDMNFFSGFGSVLEQALTIGFLVSSYFFFKRSQAGIKDWIETEDDNDDEFDRLNDENEEEEFFQDLTAGEDSEEFNEAFELIRQNRQRRTKMNKETRTCPQCNGSGRFSWSTDSSAVCDMCRGAGVMSMPSTPTSGMRGTRFLPSTSVKNFDDPSTPL